LSCVLLCKEFVFLLLHDLDLRQEFVEAELLFGLLGSFFLFLFCILFLMLLLLGLICLFPGCVFEVLELLRSVVKDEVASA
jgi:hypothetical protein